MSLSVEGTILTITGMGIAPYSARGLSQQITPIVNPGNMTRSINGRAQSWNMSQFEKYETTITCEDMRPPPFDNRWQGQEFTMECAARITRHMYELPGREVVEGSEIEEGDYISYRMVLEVMLDSFDWTEDEWGARVGWKMKFVEL